MPRLNPRAAAAAVVAASLALASCSTAEQTAPGGSAAEQATNTVTVTDNEGEKQVPSPPQRVVALDNRSFEILDSWGIKPVAAPKPLVPETIPGIGDDDSIIDIGSHLEPNLEAIVAADPDVIVSGMRYRQYDEDLKELAPQATLLEFEPREGEPFDEELIRQTAALGEVFGKQDEAAKLVDDFLASMERAKAAYDLQQTVMALNVSGGAIGYSAPHIGRVWGVVYDLLGLTPALEVDNASNNHQGDEISVEAIASANPDWVLVLDRDAGARMIEGSPSARSVIEGSAPLQNLDALKEDRVYYAPVDTYTNESIITYTEIFNDLADKFEAAK